MGIQSNHHDHWIQGSREERVLILGILMLIAMSPFVMWWFHG